MAIATEENPNMMKPENEIRWAARVPQEKVRRLYQTDATGVYHEELIHDVGWSLFARCESFLAAEEARSGRAKCHRCGRIIVHEGKQEEVLRCAECGWTVAWRAYFKTMQHRQLSGPDLAELFKGYVTRFPQAASPRERMLLIDRLLHGFHWSARTGPRRPSAINLIEGRLSEVIGFLDRLTYGDGSTPGTLETAAVWRRDMSTALASWGQETLESADE